MSRRRVVRESGITNSGGQQITHSTEWSVTNRAARRVMRDCRRVVTSIGAVQPVLKMVPDA
jgi:hypothetical protein